MYSTCVYITACVDTADLAKHLGVLLHRLALVSLLGNICQGCLGMSPDSSKVIPHTALVRGQKMLGMAKYLGDVVPFW